MRRRSRCEQGSATVLVLSAAAVVTLVAGALAAAATATVTRHRAGLAADVAALAAASHVTEGPNAACEAAGSAAARNGATLASCIVDGTVVSVRTRVAAPPWIAWAGAAQGRARAGPAAEPEEPGGVAPTS